ncbi:MAG: hypothetical protein H6512_15585 [Acidimicrobiia bacterium]|nr:hypothetical protein [Acidimicrobiia bacterium]
MSDITESEIATLSDAELASRAFHGDAPFQRTGAPEPSLLPFLADLCPPESIADIWSAAQATGRGSGQNVWPQVYESTVAALVRRFDDDQIAQSMPRSDALVEAQVYRVAEVHDSRTGLPPDLRSIWALREKLDRWQSDEVVRDLLDAKLLAVDFDRVRFERLLHRPDLDVAPWRKRCAFSERRQPDWLPAGRRTGPPLPDRWSHSGDLAHVLPAADRTGYSDLIEEAVGSAGSSTMNLHRGGQQQPSPGCIRMCHTSLAHDRRIDDRFWRPHIEPPGGFTLRWRRLLMRLFVDRIHSTDTLNGFENRSRRTLVPRRVLDLSGHPIPPQPRCSRRGLLSRLQLVRQSPAGVDFAPDAMEAEPQTARESDLGVELGIDLAPGALSPSAVTESGPDTRRGPTDSGQRRDHTVDDRRLGVTLSEEVPLRAGSEVRLDVTIALPGVAQVVLQQPAGIAFDQYQDKRILPVRFVGAGIDQTELMELDRNPLVSGQVGFRFTPDEGRFVGTIIVYDEAQAVALQAAEIAAPVIAEGAAAPVDDEAFSIRLIDVSSLGLNESRPGATLVATSHDEVFGQVADISLPVSTSGVIAETGSIVAGLVNAGELRLTTGTPIWETILVAAQLGADLRVGLGVDLLNDVDHIQMISFTTQTVFPLDLIYGGPRPADTAQPCMSWRDANDGGGCPECGTLDPVAAENIVCPLWFWGLGKVIEHHWPEPDSNPEWIARVHRSDVAGTAVPLRNVMAAASRLVAQGLRVSDASTALALLPQPVGGTTTIVENWADWETEVARCSPSVLIAIAHHDLVQRAGIAVPMLEIGGTSVRPGQRHIRVVGDDRGPLVMLLGCDTSLHHGGILSFASLLRSCAPAIVSSIGELIAEEAPQIAQVLLSELISSAQDGRTLGEALRDARRQLMSEGRPAALQLVLQGDSEWRMVP